MSSRSGEDLSGRKGTKMGCLRWVLWGTLCFGVGACTKPESGADGVASVAGDGRGWGYWDGGAGFGRRPDEFVKGWTARGSNDAKAELDIVIDSRSC